MRVVRVDGGVILNSLRTLGLLILAGVWRFKFGLPIPLRDSFEHPQTAMNKLECVMTLRYDFSCQTEETSTDP